MITPQEPDFTTYTEDFRSDYLNNIGNLSLLTWGNNSSKKNHNPASEECREIYNSSYYSQREIYITLVEKGHWGDEEINNRCERIVELVKSNWLS